MAITRTPMVDDDGSGTTGTIINNAWKQELYGQIDALAAMPHTAWTPTDISGAGLALGLSSCVYIKIGQVVIAVANLTFPATADANTARVGGFPFVAIVPCGAFSTYGVNNVIHMPASGSAVLFINPATGAIKTNAEMSGTAVSFIAVYFTN